MCKPVLVTLPFALLLLDYWPLRRFELSTINSPLSTIWRLLREKIPFLALAVASSVITIVAHRALGSLDSVSRLPWDHFPLGRGELASFKSPNVVWV